MMDPILQALRDNILRTQLSMSQSPQKQMLANPVHPMWEMRRLQRSDGPLVDMVPGLAGAGAAAQVGGAGMPWGRIGQLVGAADMLVGRPQEDVQLGAAGSRKEAAELAEKGLAKLFAMMEKALTAEPPLPVPDIPPQLYDAVGTRLMTGELTDFKSIEKFINRAAGQSTDALERELSANKFKRSEMPAPEQTISTGEGLVKSKLAQQNRDIEEEMIAAAAPAPTPTQQLQATLPQPIDPYIAAVLPQARALEPRLGVNPTQGGKPMLSQGLSLGDVSQQVGLHPQTISKIIRQRPAIAEDIRAGASGAAPYMEAPNLRKFIRQRYDDKELAAEISQLPSPLAKAIDLYINRGRKFGKAASTVEGVTKDQVLEALQNIAKKSAEYPIIREGSRGRSIRREAAVWKPTARDKDGNPIAWEKKARMDMTPLVQVKKSEK